MLFKWPICWLYLKLFSLKSHLKLSKYGRNPPVKRNSDRDRQTGLRPNFGIKSARMTVAAQAEINFNCPPIMGAPNIWGKLSMKMPPTQRANQQHWTVFDLFMLDLQVYCSYIVACMKPSKSRLHRWTILQKVSRGGIERRNMQIYLVICWSVLTILRGRFRQFRICIIYNYLLQFFISFSMHRIWSVSAGNWNIYQ